MKEKYTITVELSKDSVAELFPYYERIKELYREVGLPYMTERTFDEFLADMLMIGCKDHMLSCAKGMEKTLEHHIAVQKGTDKNGG